MDKRHIILCVRPGQYGGYRKRGSVSLHPMTISKVAHPPLSDCTFGQTLADPPPLLHHFGHAEIHPHYGHWKQISRVP